MKRYPWATGALVGAMTTLPLTATLYLGEQFADLPFIPFDLFDWLTRILPGRLLRTGIDLMVRLISTLGLGPISATAKVIEQAIAILLVVGVGGAIGAVIARAVRVASRPAWKVGGVAGLVTSIPISVLEMVHGMAANSTLAFLWLAATLSTWGATVGWVLNSFSGDSPKPREEAVRLSRRKLIGTAGASFLVAVSAWALGRHFQAERAATGAGVPLPDILLPAPGSEAQAQPAPGTRPEITVNADFYRVDIAARPPVIQGASWSMEVAGLFDRPRALSLKDLMAYPPVTETITQSCISNPIGGDLIGTTRYTGARLRDVVADLGLRPSTRALRLDSADGYYESVVIADVLDLRTLLVYGMNGVSLPIAHGFPLRIYIPNRYGMKQPKWIMRMTAVERERAGFWVERGWSKEARPRIISIIDTVATAHIETGRVPIGGIAWAGDRGIERVQLQVDEGEWRDADIVTPTLGSLAWVLWRYDWPVERGRHAFRVRAVDGGGALQIGKPAGTFPAGATGYHSVTKYF